MQNRILEQAKVAEQDYMFQYLKKFKLFWKLVSEPVRSVFILFFFSISGFSFTDTDNSQDNRGREGTYVQYSDQSLFVIFCISPSSTKSHSIFKTEKSHWTTASPVKSLHKIWRNPYWKTSFFVKWINSTVYFI